MYRLKVNKLRNDTYLKLPKRSYLSELCKIVSAHAVPIMQDTQDMQIVTSWVTSPALDSSSCPGHVFGPHNCLILRFCVYGRSIFPVQPIIIDYEKEYWHSHVNTISLGKDAVCKINKDSAEICPKETLMLSELDRLL